MSTIDLNLVFPTPINPGISRGPLPKQSEFLRSALDPLGPQYISYFGGVGSGKSLILCTTMLSQAVMYGGEYAVCRLFMPELRRTTMKQFIEILPKELLIELRVADAEIHLKTATGKKAIIYFLGLDEPDKLRSLNLSGFAIDEASQVSEEAFLELIARSRNPVGLRKGLLVGNPAGHNWVYNWFIKQDNIPPAKRSQFKMIVAPSTENKHLPEGYVERMLDTFSAERIQREVMGSWDAFEGQVYHEFRRDTHVVPPFAIPKDWTRFVGADHGYRNPACWLWGAQDYDSNIYIYKEFYQSEWLIEEICKGNKKLGLPGVIEINGDDKLEQIRIDPSTRAVRGARGESDWDVYLEHLPKDFPLLIANNDVQTGIDRVKGYLKVHPELKKPKLFIFSSCVNIIEELTTYRYEETSPNRAMVSNEKETPVKKDDHAVDSLRYLCMSRPEAPKPEDRKKHLRELQTIEGSLARELEDFKKKTVKDPFSDYY